MRHPHGSRSWRAAPLRPGVTRRQAPRSLWRGWVLALTGGLAALGLAGCWDLSTRTGTLPAATSREADVPTPQFFHFEGRLAPSPYVTSQ